jgi:aminopeptidase N
VGLPVAAYSEGGLYPGTYGSIVYGRGPLFFEALRDEMGHEAFDAFLRDYYQSHRWGIATTESLRALAEQHCGCDLEALFEDWVY